MADLTSPFSTQGSPTPGLTTPTQSHPHALQNRKSQYKASAVAFVLDEGRQIVEVARNIGVHEMTLGKWVKKERDAREAIIPPDASLTMSERAELIRLREDYKTARSENAQLRMEAEFAKKVATWFANDQQ